jgi:hypothetical protein
MFKTEAIIRKVGNQYCVFSESGGKNLGCSDSMEGAKKRLQQVEYFKHNKGSANMNYKDAFSNLGKTLSSLDPTTIGQAPEGKPQSVEVKSETLTVSEKLSKGTVAGLVSERVIDGKDHFPVITATQAQSSMTRVLQLTDVPVWYTGNLMDLRQEVSGGIARLHADMQLNIRVPVDQAVALSDGQSPAETSKTSVKDPADVAKTQVPGVARPNLTSAQVEEALADEDTRKVIAGRLMEMLDKQVEAIAAAKKTAQRLLKSGLKADEFDKLSTFLQEDILRELVARAGALGTVASEDRRRELLNKLGNKNG